MRHRLWRLQNLSGRSWWVIAPTLDRARAISARLGAVRDPASARLIGDQTEHYLAQPQGESLRALLAGPSGGMAALRVRQVVGAGGLGFQTVAQLAGSRDRAGLPAATHPVSAASGQWVLTRPAPNDLDAPCQQGLSAGSLPDPLQRIGAHDDD